MKVINVYIYDRNEGLLNSYISDNKNSFTYQFYVTSIDREVDFNLFFSEINKNKNFIENWIINDKKGNQINFTGISLAGIGSISPAETVQYAVNGSIGKKWKTVNRVQIEFKEDLTRVITLFQD